MKTVFPSCLNPPLSIVFYFLPLLTPASPNLSPTYLNHSTTQHTEGRVFPCLPTASHRVPQFRSARHSTNDSQLSVPAIRVRNNVHR